MYRTTCKENAEVVFIRLHDARAVRFFCTSGSGYLAYMYFYFFYGSRILMICIHGSYTYFYVGLLTNLFANLVVDLHRPRPHKLWTYICLVLENS